MKQLVNPNLDPTIFSGGWVLNDWLGWCLAYVEVAFNTDRVSDTATDEWNRISYRHEDRNTPSGVYVPIWFSHWGTYNGVYKNWGHVAIYKDGHIWSSPVSRKPYADEWNSIEEVEQKYSCTFIGWSEDIGNVRVIEEEDMTIPDADNYYWRYGQKLARQVRGRELSRDEFRAALVGKTDLNAVEILSDDSEADTMLHTQDVGVIAVQDNWQGQIESLTKQLNDTKVALQNAENKPPVEVVKEVEKIITKSVYINDPILAQNTQDTLTIVKSIKGMLINFIGVVKNFIKKG